jgi:small-conductance mechanosensitive channel
MLPTETLEKLLETVVAALPKVAGAFFLLLAGWIIAKVLRTTLQKVLSKTGIDKIGEKLNDIDFLAGSGAFKISSILSSIVYYVIILVFAIAASDALGLQMVSELIARFIEYIPQLISAMMLFLAGTLLAAGLKKVVASTFKSLGIPSAVLIANAIFYFILISVAVSAIEQAGIETSFIKSNLSIILGGVVLAFAFGYGLASRELLSNLLGSTYSRGKFNLGDEIKINEAQGVIIATDSTSMTLRTAEGTDVVVPLKRVAEQQVQVIRRGTSNIVRS